MKGIANSSLTLALLALSTSISAAEGLRFAVGVHDMYVPDVDSHTFGINGRLSYEKTTDSGLHLFGSYDLLVDNDKDELDPDHIPVWWMLQFTVDRHLLNVSDSMGLSWVVDFNSKANTVSSIEREIRIFPGLILAWSGDTFTASAKASVGYFFLEIDDDVPKERGYTRSDFDNDTFAVSLAANASMRLGNAFTLFGQLQTWSDNDGWLRHQYVAELRYNAENWLRDSELVIGVEGNFYNLEPYVPSEYITPQAGAYLPILPWDEDLLIRITFNTRW